MALLSRFSWREKFLSTLDMGGSILAGSVKVNFSRPFVFFFFSLFFLLEFISKRTASQSQPQYSKRYYVATPVSRPPYIMRCARAYLSTYIPRFKGVLRVFLINFHRKKLEVLEIFVFALKEKKEREKENKFLLFANYLYSTHERLFNYEYFSLAELSRRLEIHSCSCIFVRIRISKIGIDSTTIIDLANLNQERVS